MSCISFIIGRNNSESWNGTTSTGFVRGRRGRGGSICAGIDGWDQCANSWKGCGEGWEGCVERWEEFEDSPSLSRMSCKYVWVVWKITALARMLNLQTHRDVVCIVIKRISITEYQYRRRFLCDVVQMNCEANFYSLGCIPEAILALGGFLSCTCMTSFRTSQTYLQTIPKPDRGKRAHALRRVVLCCRLVSWRLRSNGVFFSRSC